jgi:hypothetical protein
MISEPVIELKGEADRPVRSIRFDVLNRSQRLLNQPGMVTDSYFDPALWSYTTNYFECFDIDLAPGTNTITLRCETFDGRLITTNLQLDVDVHRDKSPPVVSIQWPNPERQVAGSTFTVLGQVDSLMTKVVARISGNGQTNELNGIVERNGRFWVEQVPLLAKVNSLVLTAIDAAGNFTVTNLTIVRSDSMLTINPIPPAQLWQMQLTVTGQVSPPDQQVWVNGQPAQVESNGNWRVSGIRQNHGGTAMFQAVAIPKSAHKVIASNEAIPGVNDVVPHSAVSVQTSLGTEEITLNATQPTYGTFNLHLTGVAGKSYIIHTSTNLLHWTPLLTNRNSNATFDFTDTNVLQYGCRFFRVTPVNEPRKGF